jgi:hypothetical protein
VAPVISVMPALMVLILGSDYKDGVESAG